MIILATKPKRADSATLEAAAQLLRATISEAIDTLREIMQDSDNAAGARSQAAQAILNAALKYSEYAELERRITALEGAQHGAMPQLIERAANA